MVAGLLARWSCHRLECLTDFIQAYSTGLKASGCLVELYASPAAYACKESSCVRDGLVTRLLKQENTFSHLLLLAQNQADAAPLETALRPLDKCSSLDIIAGNCLRESVMRRLFDLVPRSTRSLALVNPPGYASLRWSVIRKLARHGADWQGYKMDLCIILPLEMGILRNLGRMECQGSINRLYGNEDWQAIRKELAEHKTTIVQASTALIELFKMQLKQLDYKHVDDIAPARFTSPLYYHVIWASDHSPRLKELRAAWTKERFLPCEMFQNGMPLS